MENAIFSWRAVPKTPNASYHSLLYIIMTLSSQIWHERVSGRYVPRRAAHGVPSDASAATVRWTTSAVSACGAGGARGGTVSQHAPTLSGEL
jgi:hypothetical protein